MKGNRVTWIKIYDENFERRQERGNGTAGSTLKRPGESLIKKNL